MISKKTTTSKKKKKIKVTKLKTKSTKIKKIDINSSSSDDSIVIFDEDFQSDKQKEIEEKRAYLEEARSQDASD